MMVGQVEHGVCQLVLVMGYDQAEIVGTGDLERGAGRGLAGLAESFVASAVDEDVTAGREHGEGFGGFADELARFFAERGADAGDLFGEKGAFARFGIRQHAELDDTTPAR